MNGTKKQYFIVLGMNTDKDHSAILELVRQHIGEEIRYIDVKPAIKEDEDCFWLRGSI